MTTITADATTLGRALRDVAAIVNKADTVPILAHILIDTIDDDTIRITGTDLTKRVERTVKATVTQAGSFTVEASRFAAVVSTYSGDVKLTVTDNALAVASGRSRFRFAVLPAEQYPPMPFGIVSASFTAGSDFVEALARTRHAHGVNETQASLMGALMTDRDGMEIVGLDGNRLSMAKLSMVGVPETIIPSATVDLILKLASGEFSVELADGRIRCDFGATVLTSKLIDMTYPNYARIIPSNQPHKVTVAGDDMASALSRISLVADDKERKVRVMFSEGKLTMALDTNRDQAIEEMPCNYSGDLFEIGFQAKYLRDALAALDADDVVMGMTGPSDPMMMTAAQRPNVVMICMPTRI